MPDAPEDDPAHAPEPTGEHVAGHIGDIERSIDLDVDADETWRLAGTAAGWTEWLVDVADVDIAEGAIGSVVDDGLTFAVEIDRVEPGRAVTYRWFDADEPHLVTTVHITVEPTPRGGSRLIVHEQGPLAASASTWAVRTGIVAMVMCLVAASRLALV
ncbi:MAG: SRPBCC family protein [Acidimicrobiia bacterium]